MSTSIHKDLLVAEIHQPFSYEYADATARNGASGFVSGDIGKFARQLDDNSMWMLTATTPTWKRVDGTGTGETNTASNVGTAGVGVYKQKTGVDLEFKKINAGSAKVTVVDDTGNDEVDIDVVTGTTADSVCVGNDSRLSDARTPTSHASSHQHGGSDEVATATPGANAIPKADGSGSLDAWVTHLGLTSAAPEDVTKAAAVVGTDTDAARADHKHDISTAAASSLDATSTNTEGVATSLARSDHTHEIDETGSVTDIEPDDVASAGTAQGFARKDHVHGIEASTPGQIQIGDTASEGVATAFARSDHTHALVAPAAPVNVTKATAATGSSTSPARADHKHDVTTATPVATGTSNAEGTAESLARSDHVHALSAHASTHLDGGSDEIDVADLGSTSATGADQLVRSDGAGGLAWTSAGTPGTIEPDDAAAEGSATTYSRGDHQHAIAAGTPGAVTPGDSAAEGSATAFARSDHQHSIAGFGTPGTIEPDDSAVEGVASTFARSDHQHAISADTPGAIEPDDTAVEGTATSFARSDHQHAITTAVPGAVTPDDTATEGSATSFARSDHTHEVSAFGTPGTIEPDDTAAEGVASSFARSDHQHAVAADIPGTIEPDDAAAEGSATSFARSDHQHAIAAATPGTIQPDDTAAEGTATSFARSDHTHGIVAAAPSQGIGGGNSEGAATSFSRSDHDHTIRETGGPTNMTVGSIPDGYSVRRSGTSLVGVNPYDPYRTIIVATQQLGADATSIADAITAVNALSPVPSASAPATILVHPGVYTTAPFSLPNYVSLVGVAGAEATILQASTTTSALCTANGGQRVEGLTLKGANGSGGVGVEVGGTVGTLVVKDCVIDDCETGAKVAAASRLMELEHVKIDGGTTGLLVDGSGAQASVSHLTIIDQTIGIDIGTSGGAVIGSDYYAVDDSGFTTHVRVQAASSELELMNSVFRADKTDFHTSATIQLNYGSDVPGDEAYKIIGELHVGSEARPRESCFGGGDSHVRGMAALTNTNLEGGTWNDITTSLKDDDGSSAALFAATAVGNCFYFGGDFEFPGMKVEITTAMSGGAVVLEYWNGSSWVSIPHMSSDASSPYAQYAQLVFQRANTEQVRFGIQDITGWATKNLNGITKYWVRFRVTTILTTIPSCDRAKLHTDRTEINSDGVVEYFGAAQPVRQLSWHRKLMEELEGFAQPDADIDIASGFSLKAKANRWQNGNKDGSGTFLHALPGLDTSRPIIYVVGWAPEATGAGNVELQLDVVTLNAGSVLNGALPYTHQLSEIVSGPFSTAYALQVTEFSFEVPDLSSSGSLAINLYRDASGGNLDDTFESDAMHVYSAVYGTFWR